MLILVTRKDVAARAGVSTTTVTNVLNNKGYFSPEVRAKVEQAVNELGYRPHSVARALALRQSNQIAVVVNNLDNPFFSQLYLSFNEQLNKSGYKAITIHGTWVNLDYIIEILQGQVDGIVILDGTLPKEVVKTILDSRLPLVTQGYELDAQIPTVEPNFAQGIDTVVEHILNLGHRRIAFLSGQHPAENQRHVYYHQALRDRGIPVLSELVVENTPPFQRNLEDGYRLAKNLLTRQVNFSAIIAYSDLIALGAYKALEEHGLSIPDDVSIVGWDNIPFASYSSPPLTTIHASLEHLAQQLVESLICQIRKKNCERLVRIPTELVIRKSTTVCSDSPPLEKLQSG